MNNNHKNKDIISGEMWTMTPAQSHGLRKETADTVWNSSRNFSISWEDGGSMWTRL